MTFGSEVDHAIEVMLFEEALNKVSINNISSYKKVVRIVLDIGEVGKITCIGKLIEIYDLIVRVAVHEPSYNV